MGHYSYAVRDFANLIDHCNKPVKKAGMIDAFLKKGSSIPSDKSICIVLRECADKIDEMERTNIALMEEWCSNHTYNDEYINKVIKRNKELELKLNNALVERDKHFETLGKMADVVNTSVMERKPHKEEQIKPCLISKFYK